MFICPVCGYKYLQNIPRNCEVCNWNLELTEIHPEQLGWARETWKNLDSLQEKRKKKRVTVADLLPRINAIESELTAAKIERENLRNQLDWVLYHIETINPEQVTETLSKMRIWLEDNQAENPPMSEVGMDYTGLMELLAAGEWKTADEYTWQIILYLTGREQMGWLNVEDIDNFPLTDLRTIDYLWDYYSSGLFGLTIQQQIWETVESDYSKFCDRIGWREGSWKYYDELIFNLNAPKGHLPVIPWRRRSCYGVGIATASEILSSFIERLLAATTDGRN